MQKMLIAKLKLIFPLLFILVNIFPKTIYAQKAFPSAEGYAANITGGRGGVVFEVTNLEDDVTNPPVGSLRAALKDTTSLPRTIVFRVSGVIILKGRLDIGKQNVTIAGQTAPGDGICIRKYTVKVYGKPSEGNYANVIIRHIRFRPGEETHSNTPPVYGIDTNM
ncbi:MAG: hypothetical protein HYV28_02610 [Ignavibacteriales bacterium]|nr:hypothetical protein [Ignavibacteriales bacterium]